MSDTVQLSKNIRLNTLRMIYRAKASHIGGAFSMADILAVLYNDILHIDPSDCKAAGRDRFLLSKGHACASLYATLALKGFFRIEELETYSQEGSRLLAHTSHHVPGVEISAGSLGHALPVSVGIALGAKRKKENYRTFCLVSDGELNEGSNWEAILLAPQLKLDNLILIVDFNKIQSLGRVEDVIELEPLRLKFESFRWQTQEVDGHDHEALKEILHQGERNGKPKVIIAHTVKGKGVSFMEDKLLWHYKSPDDKQYLEAELELSSQL
jgi:transketolase